MVIVGFLAGVISGMGIGGGTVLIPALTLFFDIEQKSAQNINLLYFVPTAAIALISHIRAGRIEKTVLAPIITTGLIGAAAGSAAALLLGSGILRRLFGVFLLIMSIREVYLGFKKNKD